MQKLGWSRGAEGILRLCSVVGYGGTQLWCLAGNGREKRVPGGKQKRCRFWWSGLDGCKQIIIERYTPHINLSVQGSRNTQYEIVEPRII